MPALELSRPINVRLPKALHAYLEVKSETEGVPLSILVRQAAMRQFPLPGDGTNRASDATENHTHHAHGQAGGAKDVKQAVSATTAENGPSAPSQAEVA